MNDTDEDLNGVYVLNGNIAAIFSEKSRASLVI